MDNFKITKTLLENINEQDDKIEQCIEIVNSFTKEQELNQEMILNEQIRQQNELIRQEQYNNNENRFVEINQQLDNIIQQQTDLFQSVSNGKKMIASAITDKGIATSENETFENMANNILLISGGDTPGTGGGTENPDTPGTGGDSGGDNPGTGEPDNPAEPFTPYSFGAISDIHIGYNGAEDNLVKALNVFNNNNCEFICSAGDITMGSAVDQLSIYKNTLNSNTSLPSYSCTGNHDQNFSNDVWNQYIGHPINYVFKKNNDVFIIFSYYTSNGYVGSSQDNPYGSEHMQWLREQLDLHKGKRIFLFTHIPLSGYAGLRPDTFYGFTSTSTEDDEILSLMNSNKKVIHFSGHTHFLFEVAEEYPNINVVYMNNNECATVHLPSTAYSRKSDNTVQEGSSEGFIVNVYEDRVVLKGVDFINSQFISKYEYSLPISYNGSSSNVNSIVVNKQTIDINEDETTTFTVVLSKAVLEDTTVNISVDSDNITLDKSSLTFTSSNYNIPQTVTVTGVHKDTEFIDLSSLITISGAGMVSKLISVTTKNIDIQSTESYVTKDLVIYLDSANMGETSGIWNDITGNYHMTMEGFADKTLTDGGLQFGSSKYLSNTNYNVENKVANNLSIELYLKLAPTIVEDILFNIGAPLRANRWSIDIKNNYLRSKYCSMSTANLAGISDYYNQIIHLVFTVENQVLKVYINKELVATNSTDTTNLANTLYIGTNYVINTYASFILYKFRLYHKVLSVGEIEKNYQDCTNLN